MSHLFKILIATCITIPLFCKAVSGDGNVTSEKRTVTSFRDITINGPFKIITRNGAYDDFLIRIETDKNLQQYVTVTQVGLGVFINIKPDADIEKFTKMDLYVDTRNIRSLSINSNSSIPSDIILPMTCPGCRLSISGSIPISVTVQVSCHDVNHKGDPFYDKVNHAKLIADINNARATRLSGDLEEADILNNGSGALDAYDLRPDLLRIRNNSSAAVEVYSMNDFKINNTGNGHIYYKGEGTVSELKESAAGTVCREEYISQKKPDSRSDKPTIKNKTGFNTDSLFEIMLERDQLHRQGKSNETLQTSEDDAENFECLKWYLSKHGYPEFDKDLLKAMFPTLLMHIDNYENFMQIKGYLLKALKTRKLAPNTYAYSYDRCLIAAHLAPIYYYFLPESVWDKQYKPSIKEQKKVNAARQEIGLPDYPLLLNGKSF